MKLIKILAIIALCFSICHANGLTDRVKSMGHNVKNRVKNTWNSITGNSHKYEDGYRDP